MHTACAVGARTLAVFGPTDINRWAPKCDNLHAVQAPGGCLEKLPAAAVREMASDILASISD